MPEGSSEQLFRCVCLSETFNISAKEFVGKDSLFVNEVICEECGERFGPPDFAFEIPGTAERSDTDSGRAGREE